jgi:hypothetical protein
MRQPPPGAGADGACRHRAPGVADAVPVFVLSPETALYPLIELLERVVLRFEREESPVQTLRGCVTAPARAEPMSVLGELDHLGDQLVRPGRATKTCPERSPQRGGAHTQAHGQSDFTLHGLQQTDAPRAC